MNYFQPEDVRDILKALEDEPLKWQLMANLLMITGARRGEIAGLKWEKIDEQRRRVKINSTTVESANSEIGVYETSTKTGNWRYVPLRWCRFFCGIIGYLTRSPSQMAGSFLLSTR